MCRAEQVGGTSLGMPICFIPDRKRLRHVERLPLSKSKVPLHLCAVTYAMAGCRAARPFDDAQELFHVFPRGFLAGERAEESGQARSQFCVLQNVVGDAARVHGGVLEEFEPVVRAGPATGSERGVPTPLTVHSILTYAR